MESEMNNNFSFDLPKNKSNVIKVIGVGGGGSNAINYMFQQGINGVDFVVTNTDAQALNDSSVPIKIQLGASLTEGLGAGANPEVGALAAEESFEDIKTLLTTQTKMVFITAGMGGGTGTGAAPIIAKMAKELDILTVGIITMPFQFEGKLRLEQAEKGLENLKKTVDALIVINNNKLREVYGNLGFKAGFSKADEVLSTAARGIAEVITHHYRQNIDLKDAKTVLKDSGTAIMGSGSATGTNRAQDAIINALDSPLLNDNKITGCKNVLLLIVSGNEEITIDEIGEINEFIQTEAGNNANIIMGIGEDQKLESSVSVTIIATGFGADQQHQIVNTEAKKIIHTLEEDQTLEHDLMESEVDSDPFEMPFEEGSKQEIVDEVEEEIGEQPTSEVEEKTTTFMLDEKDQEFEEEDLFSIPVVAEIVSGYDTEPEIMHTETFEAAAVESEDELIASTPAIENMEVVYEILQYDQPEEAPEIEKEEEFIINDLDEEVLDLEVVGSEEVEAEEENQFTFDFGSPISDGQEVSAEKIVHTLSEQEEEEVKEDASLSEAVDFEFEVFKKSEEIPVTDMEEVMSSPHDDSPFDKKIKETAAKANEERKEHLKKFNHAFKHSLSKIDEFEKQPAYKRMGLELDQPSSSESNESRLSVDSDKNDDIQLRSNNSFLHDNVD
ncbi:cell division protein FtsZ [Flavobacteriaceae bacterium]|nr:cell division protein FtsZ [Flavobacteriaceae bacterium]MDC3238500.1 cell division protein FtsZ [Flavobacteriaceae bacterium]